MGSGAGHRVLRSGRTGCRARTRRVCSRPRWSLSWAHPGRGLSATTPRVQLVVSRACVGARRRRRLPTSLRPPRLGTPRLGPDGARPEPPEPLAARELDDWPVPLHRATEPRDGNRYCGRSRGSSRHSWVATSRRSWNGWPCGSLVDARSRMSRRRPASGTLGGDTPACRDTRCSRHDSARRRTARRPPCTDVNLTGATTLDQRHGRQRSSAPVAQRRGDPSMHSACATRGPSTSVAPPRVRTDCAFTNCPRADGGVPLP